MLHSRPSPEGERRPVGGRTQAGKGNRSVTDKTDTSQTATCLAQNVLSRISGISPIFEERSHRGPKGGVGGASDLCSGEKGIS